MNENQLDFTGGNNKEYFLYENKKYKTFNLSDDISGTNNLKNYQIEGPVINEHNNRNKVEFNQEEQLDFYKKRDVNIFPEAKPVPLIYDSHIEKNLNKIKKKETSKKNKNLNAARKIIKSQSSKNFYKKMNTQSNSVITAIKPTQNNIEKNLNSKGLFDPNLRKNELNFPRKTTEQRKERFEKIKNYDLKFGSKVKKLQMYNNYIEMLEDFENTKMDHEINKEKFKIKEIKKLKEEIKSRLDNIPKPKYKSNNLEFDFSNHEEVIKSLEDQIENERRIRAEIKLKYEQEKMMFEKSANTIGKCKEITITERAKKLVRTHRRDVDYKKNNIKKKFLSCKSLGNFNNKSRVNHFSRRNKSANKLNNKIKELKPKLSDIIDRSFNTFFKKILHKKNNLLKNVYSGKKERKRVNDSLSPEKNIIINSEDDSKINCSGSVNELTKFKQTSCRNNICPSEVALETKTNISKVNSILENINNNKEYPQHNINGLNVPCSPMCNLDSPAHAFQIKNQNGIPFNNETSFKNYKNPIENKNSENNNKQLITTKNNYGSNRIIQNPENNLPKIKPDQVILDHDLNYNNRTLEEFNKSNKFQMLDSLNKQIDNYSKGLPNLIKKVESTLEKISKINIFDEKTHPILKMASKHSGQIIQLHTENICESIIDDLLLESVDELEKIEEIQNKKEEVIQFKGLIDDYYKNFELIKNYENEISKKISSSNIFRTHASKKNNSEKENNFTYRNPFESFENIIIQSENIYEPKTNFPENKFNPNIFGNEEIFQKHLKRKYSTKLGFGLLKNIENYSKEYFEYMKTTGTFLLPNIFRIYDEVVMEYVNDLLNDELNYCVKQLDNFVIDFYKEEIFKN